MESYISLFLNGYKNYYNYLISEITFQYTYKPWWENYFYMLIAVSMFFFLLEIIRPWRKDQTLFRKGFWLDIFYMFFNFFLFSLLVYNALSDVAVHLFAQFLAIFGISNIVAIHIENLPRWLQLFLFFIIRDFIHWWVHRWLHYSPFLWNIHKVHHSVEEMGFAAHLRYHWMEGIIYRALEFIPLSMIGFGIDDFFFVHFISLSIGHWNHSNIQTNIYFLKYIFNNPALHIWHHAEEVPENKKYGVNFGISLSIWDYLFGTIYDTKDGKNEKLGFDNRDTFPQSFLKQNFGSIFKNMR